MRVGTRASKLARLQTQVVVDKLKSKFPGQEIEIVLVTTGGDKIVDKPIAEIGSRGVFVKELEDALLKGEVDFVVHSLKDMPTDVPPGLCLAAVLEREDPRDVLASKDGVPFGELRTGAVIATSSLRRAAQLSAIRKDLSFIDSRGNIDTRLRKLEEGHCDATILAAAGLLRLGAGKSISHFFDPDELTPAAGQGALAVECRLDDSALLAMIKDIDDESVRAETECERAFLSQLGGGCSVPIGALARLQEDGKHLILRGCVAALDGSQVFRMSLTGSKENPVQLGRNVAEALSNCGAQPLIEQLRLSVPSQISPP